ncbi:ABC transporter ATP-binding protein [Candidatus Tisiphia endosymbiont of Nemotelus uliginosus]|uniref:ABC transporter ATP-binding protein n=1 Tax=Candidatus Tisiphia endosymbiont of Nemotelus uliginosus TaxID=3077926 RepID=UPI0035C8D841
MGKNNELQLYLYSLAYRYRLYLGGIAVAAIFGALFKIVVNYQTREIINIIAQNPKHDVTLTILLFIFYQIMHHMVYFVTRLFDMKYQPLILAELIESMYIKTMNHSLHWFDSHLSGEIANKITDFQDSILGLIHKLIQTLVHFAVIIFGIIFLCTVNNIVASVLIVFIMIYVPVLSILLKKQMQLQGRCVKAKQEAVGIINDSISNIFGIKIIGNVWSELQLKLVPAINKWKNWDKKTKYYDAYYVDLIDTILAVVMVATQIFLLVYLYQNGRITVGDFAFVSTITLMIHAEVGYLLDNILFSINPKLAAIQVSYNFINAAADIVDSVKATLLPRVKGNITYEEVTLSYMPGVNIFENLSLRIKAGERVGIVGKSGAGKTSWVKCLLRYFNLQKGRILIDGYDISEVTQESLRNNIAVIPQDITMFHRSILENLQLAKYDATLEQIQEACKKARIHEDIECMPQGYNSVVGERGVKLSGGQRQRIAIARAILKNAPILILDEATSALDSSTELLIQASIKTVLETSNSTTIVIAHRLSTLLYMDRILVFEHGKIIEEGTHLELLARNGSYKKLWDAQVGEFIAH